MLKKILQKMLKILRQLIVAVLAGLILLAAARYEAEHPFFGLYPFS